MSTEIRTIWAPADAVLHHIAPLGLAAAAGTALVVDLDATTSTYPGPTLADVASAGPKSEHVRPSRPGVAVLGRGDLPLGDAIELVERLGRGWPRLVLRVAGPLPDLPAPMSVVGAIPGMLPPAAGRTVWQRLTWTQRVEGPSLPPIGRRRVLQLLGAVVDPRWRWVRAWRAAWGGPWT